MRSNMSIAGHPIHPMLVAFPIGLFVWTLVADIVYLITDDITWFSIARWSGIGAIISALAAALFGFGDYFTLPMRGKARSTATAHMLLNLIITVAYIISAILMFGDDAEARGASLWVAVALHAFGTALLLVSGWLGGDLVYRYHIGMIPGVREDVRVGERVDEQERVPR
jgi:uncharacterized membrane protein